MWYSKLNHDINVKASGLKTSRERTETAFE